MGYYLGIDGGGTKTDLLLTDGSGKVVSRFKGEATNPASTGGSVASLSSIVDMIQQVLHDSKLSSCDMDLEFYLFAGISGMGDPCYREDGIRILQTNLPNAVVGWDHDGINALYSGTLGEPGGVLIAGTGSVAFGIDPLGNRIRIGGWGHLVGDEGSGYALGRLALKRIMEAWDGRGRTTGLTDVVLSHWSLTSPEEIIKYINGKRFKQQATEIVPLVFTMAKERDGVALEIIAEIARQQGLLIKALVEQLGRKWSIDEMPIVLAGGLFSQPEWFVNIIEEELRGCSIPVKLICPETPPVMGALVSAYKLAGLSLATILENLKRAGGEIRVMEE